MLQFFTSVHYILKKCHTPSRRQFFTSAHYVHSEKNAILLSVAMTDWPSLSSAFMILLEAADRPVEFLPKPKRCNEEQGVEGDRSRCGGIAHVWYMVQIWCSDPETRWAPQIIPGEGALCDSNNRERACSDGELPADHACKRRRGIDRCWQRQNVVM